jgi:hypothetical protein
MLTALSLGLTICVEEETGRSLFNMTRWPVQKYGLTKACDRKRDKTKNQHSRIATMIPIRVDYAINNTE